mmetsp:Transcript_90680/g.234161  ORF Transcript_90680/g.234161 Transcript_90680/m.234161 type:complete len:260 (+) Transcript_90680:1236-2015(+)
MLFEVHLLASDDLELLLLLQDAGDDGLEALVLGLRGLHQRLELLALHDELGLLRLRRVALSLGLPQGLLHLVPLPPGLCQDLLRASLGLQQRLELVALDAPFRVGLTDQPVQPLVLHFGKLQELVEAGPLLLLQLRLQPPGLCLRGGRDALPLGRREAWGLAALEGLSRLRDRSRLVAAGGRLRRAVLAVALGPLPVVEDRGGRPAAAEGLLLLHVASRNGPPASGFAAARGLVVAAPRTLSKGLAFEDDGTVELPAVS